MAISCMIIAASLCVTHPADVKANDWGLGLEFHISDGVFDVAYTVSTDYLLTPDWRKMPVACSGKVCVRYYRHCVPGVRPTCTYWFSEPGDDQNQVAELSADDVKALTLAQSSLAIVTDGTPIPLTELSVESEGAGPPLCDRRAPPSACLPLP
jgi:hypothetical protein